MLNLEANLPPLSDIFISIFPINDDGANTTCSELQFSTGDTEPPRCTEIINPRDGDVLVPVNNNITWIRDFIATGYLMTIRERDPNGVLILDNEPVGNGTNFKPPNFEPRTRYFVKITPFNDAGPAENCQAISFTTGDPLPLPDCAEVNFPLNGTVDVPVDTSIQWNTVSDADGYILSIGTTLNGFDIVNNQDVGTDTNYNIPDEFPMGAEIYVKVASYKDGEMSESCPIHSFVTKSPEILQSVEFIPNFFTPNNDGINDTYGAFSSDCAVDVLQFFVCDQWGNKLYERLNFLSTDIDHHWDGTFENKEQANDTYVFLAKIKTYREEIVYLQGDFQLIR